MDYLKGLDPDQREAVLSTGRRLLVSAGPGSGKTRVLACRFARLIEEGVHPSAILCVTFTNRAAAEMRSRIHAMAGLDPGDPHAPGVETFHGFSLRLIRGFAPGVPVYGRSESIGVLRELGVRSPARTAARISFLKSSPEIEPEGEDAEILRAYNGRLGDALDLDDLVPAAADALEDGRADPPALEHIMIDEFQDINPAQERLISLLLSTRFAPSLMAIGDPDQAIYSFRGASPKSFLSFESEHPGSCRVSLKVNYRSAGRIVSASGALIGRDAGERLGDRAAVQGLDGRVRVVECADERAEAGFIVREIESMMGGLSSLTASSSSTRAFSDFAVLFRTRRQAGALAEAFGRSSVPFSVARTPDDLAGFIEHLKALCPATDAGIEDFVTAEARAFGLGCEAAERLATLAAPWRDAGAAGSLRAFLDHASLVVSEERIEIEADKVKLMTLHAAKGLEFPVVFIAGLEDGLVPLRPARGTCDMEEERRLLYVGMTRAMDSLYLLRARSRHMRGSVQRRSRSPFIGEIPGSLVEEHGVVKKKKRRAVQKGLFD